MLFFNFAVTPDVLQMLELFIFNYIEVKLLPANMLNANFSLVHSCNFVHLLFDSRFRLVEQAHQLVQLHELTLI